MRLPSSRSFSALAALAFCAASIGCTGNVLGSPEAADADLNTTSTAVVVVERTVSAGDAQATAVARFVRMRSGAVDDDALRMVGATVDFPALGTCTAAPGGAALQGSNAARAVELLDVGAISLEANGLLTNLQARQLPDVVDLVSGVVYSTRATSADALPAEGVYVLRAAGALELDVAPFSVSASAPGEPADVRIAGLDPSSAGQGIALATGAAVELTWEPGNVEDLVYVDVAGAPEAQAARCLFTDGGRASLASAVFGDGSAAGTITLHRLHREPFRVKGIESGEIRFDFARAVSFTRL